MGQQTNYILFFIWLSYLIITSILLFTRGFLLSREVQNNNSTCLSHEDVPCPEGQSYLNNITNGNENQCHYNEKILKIIDEMPNAGGICLPPKARVVLLIVDALRYDFTVYDKKNEKPTFYQNKLPIIHELREKYPTSTRLYKFIADPPTTTMQRLKALTTGSLPTFIDAGSNFATYEINEDNLIDQLNRNNYKTVFMGDDTWEGLYPNRFLRNYPFPSFNVWDLDTVDIGVTENLFPELKKSDWNLLIGHYLGVDHVGHKHGPSHPEMSRKLGEVNEVIERVVKEIDKNTMLFVIGDHGMTVTGDHGGESTDEVTAGMFVYSKETLFKFQKDSDSVKQVDLVPTLSAILGIPTPFQSLGNIILNCLPITNKTNQIEEWKFAMFSMWANVQQVFEYIKVYSEKSDTFKVKNLKSYFEKYSVLNSKLLTINSEVKFTEFSRELSEFIASLRTMCEEVWVQFDSHLMSRGLLFLFLSIFFVYTIVDGIPLENLPHIFKSSFVLFSFGSMCIATIFVCALKYFEIIDELLYNVFFINGVVSQVMLVMLIVQNWEVVSETWHARRKLNKTVNTICRFIMVFNVCGVFSNSYIIEESFVLMFLLVTVILLGTIGIGAPTPVADPKKNKENTLIRWSKIKLFFLALCIAGLVRCTLYFWRCREEQQWCFAMPHEVNNITSKMETSKVQFFITLVCLGLFIFVTKVWLRECGNLNGYAINVIMAKYLPSVLVVCIAGYWGLSKYPQQQKKNTPYIPENFLAWSVYGFAYFGLLTIIFDPLCVYILPRKDGEIYEDNLDTKSNIIPQIFNRMKKAYSEKRSKDGIPIVCGLGTVYSAVYVICGIYVTLIFCLLLGDFVAPSAVIMFLTAGFVLIITSVIRIQQANTIESLFDIPNISILVWVILSQYFFYGTGHQTAFPNINWNSAFVGLRNVPMLNYIPATLVIVNTFCSHMLMGFLLPLVLIAPFNVFVMIPSVVGKKHDLQTASQRGEVLLYERDDVMITSTFTLACKYVMCHGLRVFACMLSATIHCRHLMVWKIFAPKLIFESIGMIVTIASVFLGYLVLIRINKKVDKLVSHLNKIS
ncbi:unnamed protein product [Brassicogethes aeneus]|uniref:GPI ethanolamine phosphate transferase 3, catalytic subunit n=1 Tax=Brassicogethes aeneus TaxID=1431903 RepID=A0A9P0AUY8_BRAAE|nr:unnamed protein product [Brassicogethes aeneus]